MITYRDLRDDFVHENWASVRTHVVNGPVQARYNHRLTSMDTRDLHDPLGQLFDEQTTAFKVNLSFGFILKEKQSVRLRYYHSSNNCCGRFLEEPSLVTNLQTFNTFLERIEETDVLQWAIAQRPNSDWVVELVTNVTFFINCIVHHLIGCLSDYVKRNKAIVGLEKDDHNAIYRDILCLFRCLGLHLGREAAALLDEYTDTPVYEFVGVTLDDLLKVESKFETNVTVYQLVQIANGETVAELVRWSPAQYPETMYANLHETHFSYIQDIGMYCHSYRCRKCEKPYGKVRGTYSDTNARTRPASTGYKKGVFTIRFRQYSNAWMMKVSLSTNRCGTIPTEQHSTSNAVSPGVSYPPTPITCNGWHVTYR